MEIEKKERARQPKDDIFAVEPWSRLHEDHKLGGKEATRLSKGEPQPKRRYHKHRKI